MQQRTLRPSTAAVVPVVVALVIGLIMGQFERTLIIAEPGSYVHYVEGCTAPTYSTNSLHSAVVEIIVKEGARVRYTTIQNWSHNVYNLVTKRSAAYKDAVMEWVDGNLGSKLTMLRRKVRSVDFDPQAFEDAQDRAYVFDVGHIPKGDSFFGE